MNAESHHLECLEIWGGTAAVDEAVSVPGLDLYVYSHTHRARRACSPFSSGSWSPLVVNTGAWQRVASPQYLEGLQSGVPYSGFRIDPEDLAPCYSLVVVIDGQVGTPRILFWRYWENAWGLGLTCPQDPALLPGDPDDAGGLCEN